MCVTVPKVPVLMASCDSTRLSPKSATCAPRSSAAQIACAQPLLVQSLIRCVFASSGVSVLGAWLACPSFKRIISSSVY